MYAVIILTGGTRAEIRLRPAVHGCILSTMLICLVYRVSSVNTVTNDSRNWRVEANAHLGGCVAVIMAATESTLSAVA